MLTGKRWSYGGETWTFVMSRRLPLGEAVGGISVESRYDEGHVTLRSDKDGREIVVPMPLLRSDGVCLDGLDTVKASEIAVTGEHVPTTPTELVEDAYRKIADATGRSMSDIELRAAAVYWLDEERAGLCAIGKCYGDTRTATVYAVEAARRLCSHAAGRRADAKQLLHMALAALGEGDRGEADDRPCTTAP